MVNQTNYLFFNLLIVGLLVSEFYRKNEQSQRLGLALGLAVVGLFTVLRFPQSKQIIKEDWPRIGATLLLIVSLTCTGEVLWGELEFKVILMCLLLIFGLLMSWAQGEWGALPPLFWLCVSLGAVVATLTLGTKTVDLGAYSGAWGWLLIVALIER